MNFARLASVLVFFTAASNLAAVSAAPTVEVLHWWTRIDNHDREAVESLKAAFEKAGGRWIDDPAHPPDWQEEVQARLLAGKMPPVVTIGSEDLRKYGEQGALADISDVAQAEHWDKLLPRFVENGIKYQGRTVAIPIVLHRLNFMLASSSVLKKSGVEIAPGWPHDWDEFNAAAEKIKKAGFIPLAAGSPYMQVILFQSVVLGLGGPRFFQKAIVEMDPNALSSPLMVRVFDQMRRLRGYADKRRLPSRVTTQMIARGEAGMQICADANTMDLFVADKKPGTDFLCLDSPGSAGSNIVSLGVLAVFKAQGEDVAAGQKLLASVAMSREAQERYSVIKRTIPIRLDIPTDQFDPCTRKNAEDFRNADLSGRILAGAPEAKSALADIVVRHFNSDMSSEEAVKMLAHAARNAR